MNMCHLSNYKPIEGSLGLLLLCGLISVAGTQPRFYNNEDAYILHYIAKQTKWRVIYPKKEISVLKTWSNFSYQITDFTTLVYKSVNYGRQAKSGPGPAFA